MKAKYRFVGKYLKNNAFLNDTKCTLAQVQPYNATFTVTLLSWPNNYSEYFFYLTWSAQVTFLPLISIRRLKASVLRLNFYLKTTGHLFQNSSFILSHLKKKSKGIVIITIKQSSKILKFMAHIIWPDWWP